MASAERVMIRHPGARLLDCPERLLPVMRETALLAAESLQAEYGGIAQPLPDGKSLAMTFVSPPSRAAAVESADFESPSGEADSLSGYALHVGETVVIQDLTVEIRFADVGLNDMGVISAVVVPLRLRDEKLGTLGVYSVSRREFSSDEIQSLTATGKTLASLIARLGGHEKASESASNESEKAAPMPSTSLTADEQRAYARHEYGYTQMISPIIGGMMPERDSFFYVECKDISQSGISFYVRNMPVFQDLVVRLGMAGSVTYFTARVMRSLPVVRDGQKMCLTGCRFTGRIEL